MSWVGRLCVDLVDDDAAGVWVLLEPFGFSSAVTGATHTAPAGFKTDFCSVPRLPIAYDLLGNRARKAGTIHDWLYTSKEVDREKADMVLREMLQQDGVSTVEAQAFYLAVRLGGGSHWK